MLAIGTSREQGTGAQEPESEPPAWLTAAAVEAKPAEPAQAEAEQAVDEQNCLSASESSQEPQEESEPPYTRWRS